jgi:hypothetical protein
VQSLQGEWQYLQRVVPGTEDAFAPLEDAIARIFLPALLEEPAENLAPLRELLDVLPRQAGLGVASPQVTATTSHESSVKSTGYLANTLKAGDPLDATAYAEIASQNATVETVERFEWQRMCLCLRGSVLACDPRQHADCNALVRRARGLQPRLTDSMGPSSRPRSSETAFGCALDFSLPSFHIDVMAAMSASLSTTPCRARREAWWLCATTMSLLSAGTTSVPRLSSLRPSPTNL